MQLIPNLSWQFKADFPTATSPHFGPSLCFGTHTSFVTIPMHNSCRQAKHEHAPLNSSYLNLA
eukprot:5765946-Amphidinium_carterae.2